MFKNINNASKKESVARKKVVRFRNFASYVKIYKAWVARFPVVIL